MLVAKFEAYPFPSTKTIDRPPLAVDDLRSRASGRKLVAYSFDFTDSWFGPYEELLGSATYEPLFEDPDLCSEFAHHLVDEVRAELTVGGIAPLTGIRLDNTAEGLLSKLESMTGGLNRIVPKGISHRGKPSIARVDLAPVYRRLASLRTCLTPGS